jgi:hypothetical protein
MFLDRYWHLNLGTKLKLKIINFIGRETQMEPLTESCT